MLRLPQRRVNVSAGFHATTYMSDKQNIGRRIELTDMSIN